MTEAVRNMPFTDQERARGIFAIYANTFLMYGGFFMVIPLISIHYGSDLGWSGGTIGAVLAVRQLVQQGLALIGGIIADRVGARLPIVAGLLVRAAGFGWMAFADTPVTLFGAAILAALGGSLFEAPKSAAGAALTSPAERPAFYRTLGIVGNVGMALGPAVGALLLRFDFAVVSLAAAAIFVIAAVLAIVWLPPVPVSSGPPRNLADGMVLALRDRRFVIFTVLVMGYWFLAVQYNITIPLMVKAIGGSDSDVGLTLFLYSAVTIVAQYPLLRGLEGRLSAISTTIAGLVIMAVGLGAIALAGSLWPLVACTVVFAVGNVMALPMLNTITARLVNPVALGSYFAVGAYALAIGGSVGSYSGGTLFQLTEGTGFGAVPWLTFAAVGVAAALGFVWFARALYPGDGYGAAPDPAPEREAPHAAVPATPVNQASIGGDARKAGIG